MEVSLVSVFITFRPTLSECGGRSPEKNHGEREGWGKTGFPSWVFKKFMNTLFNELGKLGKTPCVQRL